MLTDEEKRLIEERVRYENEIRSKINNENLALSTDENRNVEVVHDLGYNPMTERAGTSEIKNEIIPKLKQALQFVKTVNREFDDVSRKEGKLASSIQYYNSLSDSLKGYLRRNEFTRFKRILCISLLLALGVVYVVEEIVKNTAGRATYNRLGNQGIGWIILLSGTALFMAIGVSIRFIIYKNRYKNTDMVNKPLALKEIENDKLAYNQKVQYLRGYIKENMYKIEFLPAKYRREESIEIILDYFESHRVESFKEAFNLYEQEKRMGVIIEKMETMDSKLSTIDSKMSEMMASLEEIASKEVNVRVNVW